MKKPKRKRIITVVLILVVFAIGYCYFSIPKRPAKQPRMSDPELPVKVQGTDKEKVIEPALKKEGPRQNPGEVIGAKGNKAPDVDLLK